MCALQLRVFFLSLVALFCLELNFAWAAAKRQTLANSPFVGKKVLRLLPIANLQIEMPDRSIHNFGEDFEASLITQLTQSGRYIVIDDSNPLSNPSLQQQENAPSYQWAGSVFPSVVIEVEVSALNFKTGEGGERMFYGFSEYDRTPFNDGTASHVNEFPLRLFWPQANWFGRTFDRKGIVPFDSQSGLDLGDGFTIDFLFAWLSVKYARYHSELHLRLHLKTPFEPDSQVKWVEVTGDGFFFDVAGAYEGYSAGISMARKDAMNQSLKKAIGSSFDAVDRALKEEPLMAKVDGVLRDGTILLGTGPFSDVQPGLQYESVEHPEIVVEVNSSVASGSVGKMKSGNLTDMREGMLMRQMVNGNHLERTQALAGAEGTPDASETIQLKSTNLPQLNLDGYSPSISRRQAFAKSIVEAIFLPYRIWRYFKYNQPYYRDADDGSENELDSDWNYFDEKWARNIGLNRGTAMKEPRPDATPVVAVIDSGIDYNHPVIHYGLWINPAFNLDPKVKDRYGWDFISEDARPYDDGYHGTEIASVITAISPYVKIMPLKVFNPWGITTSAALYSAFMYAVDHGAKVIVCGWATPVKSKALEMGVEYARNHGVAVVAAAGDEGMELEQTPYYPASFSEKYDNVLTVTGVTPKDDLIQVQGRVANSDPQRVRLAAPGEKILVAHPRWKYSRETSTGLAAALGAGALVRKVAESPRSSVVEWISELLTDAQSVPQLERAVKDGKRLMIR